MVTAPVPVNRRCRPGHAPGTHRFRGTALKHAQIGNLRDSLQFFASVLGMRALRHEEFASGCEATCNGP